GDEGGGERRRAVEDRLRIEVENAGGPWRGGAWDDGRPHGFDVVAAIAGAGDWGIEGDGRGRTARGGGGTTGGRTGWMWWRRLPGRGTGASRGTPAGVRPGFGLVGEVRMAFLP